VWIPEPGKPSNSIAKLAITSERDGNNSFGLAKPYTFHLAMYRFERAEAFFAEGPNGSVLIACSDD